MEEDVPFNNTIVEKFVLFGRRHIVLLVFIAAFLSRIIYSLRIKAVMWDTAAYLMNAKWFLGEKIYLEILRAPGLPLMLAGMYRFGFESDRSFFIFSIILASLSITLAFQLARKMFGIKTAVFSALALIVLPLHYLWSLRVYTEIPSSIFVLMSLWLMYESRKNELLEYASIFTASLAFLTRYPTAPLVIALVLYLLVNKRLTVRKLLLMFVIGSLPVALWASYNYIEFGDPFITYKEGVRWSGLPEPFYFYFMKMPFYLSFFALLIIPAGRYVFNNIKDKRIQLLLIPLVLFLIATTLTAHKEERFLLPFIPVFVILSLCFVEKLSWKKTVKFMLPILLMCALHSTVQNEMFIYFDSCNGIIAASQNLNGTVASTHWPLTAYYGSVDVIPIAGKHDLFKENLYNKSASFVLTSSAVDWVEDANNFTFLDDQSYLELEKEVSDDCQTFRVYSVR